MHNDSALSVFVCVGKSIFSRPLTGTRVSTRQTLPCDASGAVRRLFSALPWTCRTVDAEGQNQYRSRIGGRQKTGNIFWPHRPCDPQDPRGGGHIAAAGRVVTPSSVVPIAPVAALDWNVRVVRQRPYNGPSRYDRQSLASPGFFREQRLLASGAGCTLRRRSPAVNRGRFRCVVTFAESLARCPTGCLAGSLPKCNYLCCRRKKTM